MTMIHKVFLVVLAMLFCSGDALNKGEGSRTSARNHKNFETLTTTWENSSDGGSSSGVEVELASDEQPRRMLQAIEPGSVWTLQNTPTSNSYTAVTFGNGTFVAVASEGTNFNKVMSSSDGITWTNRYSPTDNVWYGVTWGNGLFVAVSSGPANGQRVISSPDGSFWTARSAPDHEWSAVTWGNGLFVAVSRTYFMSSPDGITWTLGARAYSFFTGVAYGGGVFVAVSNGYVSSSSDGLAWTDRNSAALNNWRAVTWGNNIFVAVASSGTGNRVQTSPTGITWTSRTSAADNDWKGVTWGNGIFVAVSNNGFDNRVMTSWDGVAWATQSSAANQGWSAVTYGKDLFVAVGSLGAFKAVQTSPASLTTRAPTKSPTTRPTTLPTQLPSQAPTTRPPTSAPSTLPTQLPSQSPTILPSQMPSQSPSQSPTMLPSTLPSQLPSSSPSESPSVAPSTPPTQLPSQQPTIVPTVALSDPNNPGQAAGSLTFSTVLTSGVTTLSSVDVTSLPALPISLRPGSPPVAYDITTTTTFSGTIALCLNYQAGSMPSTGNLFLLHYSSGAWADVTTSVDRGADTICGQVSSLSPFVVASDSITNAPTLVPTSAPTKPPSSSDLTGSARDDPHFIGASGVVYDFNGEPDGTYRLFSAPQFQVTMHLAGEGPRAHFMTQIGLLFKGESFMFGGSTMTEAFRADLEERLTRVGGTLLEWSPDDAKLALCPGHTVSISHKYRTVYWRKEANGTIFGYYNVEIVAPGCHDAYDGALGQTYKCRYAGRKPEVFAWSHDQEETFRLPTLLTPTDSYSAKAPCDAPPTGASSSAAPAPHHQQRRGLASGGNRPAESHTEPGTSSTKSHDMPISVRRYRKRTSRRTTESGTLH